MRALVIFDSFQAVFGNKEVLRKSKEQQPKPLRFDIRISCKLFSNFIPIIHYIWHAQNCNIKRSVSMPGKNTSWALDLGKGNELVGHSCQVVFNYSDCGVDKE